MQQALVDGAAGPIILTAASSCEVLEDVVVAFMCAYLRQLIGILR